MTINLPPSGRFTQLINGYFGNFDQSVKDVIWTSFLEEEGLTTAPPDTDSAQLQKFANYVTSYYDNLLVPDVRVAERTKVVWTIFDILIAMMNTMTTTQVTSQRLRAFLTRKQDEYRQQMNKSVLYISAPISTNTVLIGNAQPQASQDGVSTVTTPNQDPALFNLGYGNITIKDVLEYLVGQADQNFLQFSRGEATTNPMVTFNLGGNMNGVSTVNGATYSYQFDVQKISSTDYTIRIRINDLHLVVDQVFGNHLAAATSADSGTITTSDPYASLKTNFYNIYNNPPPVPPRMSARPPLTIFWPDKSRFTYGGTDQSLQNLYAQKVGIRAENNKRMQSFIDANKSRSDILQDFSAQQGQVVDAASTGKSATSNLLQTTIRQLQTILTAIFKK